MAFYQNRGTPPDDDQPPSMKETAQVVWLVFRVLALPIALILGGVGYLVLVFFLFTVNAILGFVGILGVVGALAGLGIWEKTHPPDIDSLHKHRK